MRRFFTLVILLTVCVAPLAGAADVATANMSSPDTTSSDLDILFIQGGTLHYVDSGGTVTDTAIAADEVGGAADWDNDGITEIALRDGLTLKVADIGGNVSTPYASDILSVGGMADVDNDGSIEITLLKDTNTVVRGFDDNGEESSIPYYGDQVDVAESVGDTGDLDSDGVPEVLIHTNNGRLVYGGSDGGGRFGASDTSASSAGAVIDIDDDSTIEALFESGGTLSAIEPGGSQTNLGPTGVTTVGGAGDRDADGNEEVAYISSGGTIAVVDSAGSVTDTGVSATDVGAMVDIDDDGDYQDAPTATNASPDGTTVSSDPVTLSVDIDDSEFPIGDSVTVDIDHEGADVTQTTINSAQTVTGDVQDVQNGTRSWTVNVTDAAGNSNSYSYSYTASYKAPNLSNPQPSGEPNGPFTEISVDVTDADFPNGDEVTATAKQDGQAIGSDTLTSNGTATVDYDAQFGNVTINWTATDSHGLTDTIQQNITSPDGVQLRNETSPTQVIGCGDISGEFVLYEEDGPIVSTRTCTNGVINMSGLPLTEYTLVITDDSDRYYDREFFVDNPTEEQNAYLLNTTYAPNAPTVEFVLDDQTGTFDPDTSTIRIQRALDPDADGNTTWDTVAGDQFNAPGAFFFTGEQDARYRIIVENEDGDRRVLGPYKLIESRVEILTIGQVNAVPDTSRQGYTYSASYDNSSATKYVIYEFNDSEDQTDSVTLRIVERHNTSNVLLANQTFSGPLGAFSVTTAVPPGETNTTWVVQAWIDRNDETKKVRAIVGPRRPVLGGLPNWLVSILFVGSIFVVAGLFSQLNGDVGALVVAGMGGLFWFVDLVPTGVEVGVIVLAMVVAALIFINERRGQAI